MAKVKIKFDITSAEKQIGKLLKKVKKNKQLQNEIGQTVIDKIAFQARRGKPLNNDGTFPGLTDGSKSIRDFLSKNNPTHPAFKKNRSNITFTGQLIDGLKFRFNSAISSIEIFIGGTRTPVEGSPGKQKSTNKAVDDDLRSRGFIMFTARGVKKDLKLKKRVTNIVRATLRRALAVNNKLDKIK